MKVEKHPQGLRIVVPPFDIMTWWDPDGWRVTVNAEMEGGARSCVPSNRFDCLRRLEYAAETLLETVRQLKDDKNGL